jgi:hypothetical protein
VFAIETPRRFTGEQEVFPQEGCHMNMLSTFHAPRNNETVA